MCDTINGVDCDKTLDSGSPYAPEPLGKYSLRRKLRLKLKLTPKQLLMPLACLLGIAVNSFLYLPVLPYILHGNNDFICFYAAAELAGTKGLYNVDSIGRAEAELGDRRHFVVFTRLPYYAAWISPLRFFSFDAAYWIWQTASLAGVLLFIYFWPAPARWMTAMACCWSLPLLECFVSGQDRTI